MRREVVARRIVLPLWVDTLLREAAEKEGVAMSTLAASLLEEACRDTIGLPKKPEPAGPVPGLPEVLRSYVEGQPLIGPCGEAWPCGFDKEEVKWIGAMEFCGKCNVRVH